MIHVENLTKSFGDFKAVDGISFDVCAGEIFAFLGPNGAGKTTTIQILTTLLRPTAGQITIDNLDPLKSQSAVRSRFGIVFQDPTLDVDLTARENMELHGVLYFLIMPTFFLSGALYPLGNLPKALAVATRIDPLSYGIDGLRGAMINASHFPLALDAAILAAVASVFVVLGAWAFSRIQV